MLRTVQEVQKYLQDRVLGDIKESSPGVWEEMRMAMMVHSDWNGVHTESQRCVQDVHG